MSFGYKREGVSLSTIKPAFWGMTFLGALRYARTTLYFLNISPSEIDREFSPYSATSVETSLIREKRNDAFNPSRGYFSSLNLQYAFPLFATESDFLKLAFKYQRYYSPLPRVVLGGTFRLGLGVGRMPIHSAFSRGSNSFRGQKFDNLGPQDPQSGNPVGEKPWSFSISRPSFRCSRRSRTSGGPCSMTRETSMSTGVISARPNSNMLSGWGSVPDAARPGPARARLEFDRPGQKG